MVVRIGPSELVDEARKQQNQQRRAFWISLVIAVLGGMLAVQAFADTFGSLQQYLIAILSGAGVNITATGSVSGWGNLTSRVTALWPAKGP